MNNSFFRKLSLGVLVIGSLFLGSCGGGSSDNDEEVFEFKSSDLTNKNWYANPYIDQKFTTDDAIIVYRFNGGGGLIREEFSGRRELSEEGSWSLSTDNVLTIDDASIDVVQEWKIDKSSTRDHILLKSTVGNRDFYSNINELSDLTADAVIVNEVLLENNQYVSKYKYEFEVVGEAVTEVKVILSNSEKFDLIQAKNSKGQQVWRLDENDINYFTEFPGKKEIKFYVRMNSGEEYKMVEQIYEQDINAMNYQSVKSEHSTGNGPLSVEVEWKAIGDEMVDYYYYYYVQILNSEKDENNPLFTSNWQPESNDDLQTLTLEEKSAGEFGLSLGETFYVKVVAFLYEEEIDPYQGDIFEFNVQARSQFIRSGGDW